MNKLKQESKFSMIFPLLFRIQKLITTLKRVLNMKVKLLTLTFPILILACDEIPNYLVEQKINYQIVEFIEAPDSFYYSFPDSSFVTSIKLNNSDNIENLWLKVSYYDGSFIIHHQIFMSDKGDFYLTGDKTKEDNIYSAIIPMSKKFSAGKYLIEYYIQNKTIYSYDDALKVAVHTFNYNNLQINLPPVINELMIPTTVRYEQRIVLKARVADPNGLNDISNVYYELYRPDGSKMINSQGISQFPLFDDGNTQLNGDETARDGIYTVFLTFPAGQPSGQWKFEFYAKDKSNLISDKTIHYLTLR